MLYWMGEEGTDNLQELEDSLAEEYAAEDGGTGLSYYKEDGYDYDASSPLTDIDYQGPNESDAYTANGTGAEAYNPVANRDDDDDRQAGQDDYDDYGVSSYDDDDDDGNSNGRRRNDPDEDDDEDEDDENGGEDDDEGGNENDEVGQANNPNAPKGGANPKDDKYNGAIKWKPGQPITVKLLDQVWGKCKRIKQVRPMCDALNEAVGVALNNMGPNLMLRLNNYIEKNTNTESDNIDCLLKLAKSNGRRLTFAALASIEALFDQQWLQPALISSLNEPTVQAVFMIPQVKAVANAILTVAVPLINQMDRGNKDKWPWKTVDNRFALCYN